MLFSGLLAVIVTSISLTTTAQLIINEDTATIAQTCEEIQARFSNSSEVIVFRGVQYFEAIDHWIKSSEQKPVCVVQPSSAKDLSLAIQAIGQKRVPFAVQSGGHTSNPGFSSTKGVHISLSKLIEVTLSPDGSTVRVGFGNRWLDVYKKLEGTGRNVVGGRVPGPGLGGFTLGGGYSWKTNSYGLTIDTVKSFTLILPNGTITTVDSSTPDLFFALRGGLNRFGVVADAELYTHEQVPLIYGGTRLYGGNEVDRIVNATSQFEATNTDPKATVITSILGSGLGPTATTQFFYDGPQKPASFQVFDGISTVLIDSVKTQKFSDFVANIPSDLRKPTNFRGYWETFSTTGTTLRFLQALKKEAVRLGKLPRAPTGVNLAIDAYIPGVYGSKAVDNIAFPHSDSQFPVLLDVAWTFPTDDSFWHDQIRRSRDTLETVASEEGLLHPISYANYAAADTPAQDLYGAANAARLASIRDQVDPDRVMDLTGGYLL